MNEPIIETDLNRNPAKGHPPVRRHGWSKFELGKWYHLRSDKVHNLQCLAGSYARKHGLACETDRTGEDTVRIRFVEERERRVRFDWSQYKPGFWYEFDASNMDFAKFVHNARSHGFRHGMYFRYRPLAKENHYEILFTESKDEDYD